MAALSVAMTSMAATRADSIRAKFLDPQSREVLVAVHRGDWRNYAENSLEGIDNAIKLGADIVEVDLKRTVDGELVLMHDKTVDRTTTGKGKVEDLTLAEIKQLYLKSGVGQKTPYRVPTLREAMTANKGRALFNLDQAFDYFDDVMKILDETGTASQVVMKGSATADEVKTRYGKYLDRLIYMPIVKLDDRATAIERVNDFMSKMKPAAIELVYRDTVNVIPGKLKPILKGKTRLWYNSLWGTLAGGRDDFASLVNPADGFGFLIDSLGCSVIQTDQPQFLIGYLADRGLKKAVFNPVDAKRFSKKFKAEEREKQRSSDWAQFYRYEKMNRELEKAPDVVFMGNSITDNWPKRDKAFFTDHNIAGRGISGQTSSHMLARFQSDVVDLHPKAVVILAGTNDIARNNGTITLEHVFQNIKSMCEIARANKIKPIIASVLPSTVFHWDKSVKPANDIRRLNEMLQRYAKENKIPYVDYHSAMTNDEGGLPANLSKDGCHPTLDGYKIMERVVMPYIAPYLKEKYRE